MANSGTQPEDQWKEQDRRDVEGDGDAVEMAVLERQRQLSERRKDMAHLLVTVHWPGALGVGEVPESAGM